MPTPIFLDLGLLTCPTRASCLSVGRYRRVRSTFSKDICAALQLPLTRLSPLRLKFMIEISPPSPTSDPTGAFAMQMNAWIFLAPRSPDLKMTRV